MKVLVLKPTVIGNDELTVGYVYEVDAEVAKPLLVTNNLIQADKAKVKTVKE